MPAVRLEPSDLAPFIADLNEAKALALITDARARAARVAPCINDATLSDDNEAAAKALLRDAVLRKYEAGSGAIQAQTSGPFSVTVDTRQPTRATLWPSEITELQDICRSHTGRARGRAFTVDLAPPTTYYP